jgi:hydrogenase 3 maturation protease
LNSHRADADLREALRECLRVRVCFMGVGNTDYGDDGFGVRLAEELSDAGLQNVIIARTSPERYLATIRRHGFHSVILLDTVEFGGTPGSIVFLDGEETAARFPQISTHKMSLALIAKLLASEGIRAFLLGVQPESVKFGQPLTGTAQTTLSLLKKIFFGLTRECDDRDLSLNSAAQASSTDVLAHPAKRKLSEVIA